MGIVGGSAAGLALACGLAWCGVECRLYEDLEEHAGAGEPSTLGSRSMETLDRWGLLAPLLSRGLPLRRSRITYRGQTLGYLPTSEMPSRFPYILSLLEGSLRDGLAEGLTVFEGVRPCRGPRAVGLRLGKGGAEVLGEDGRPRRHRFVALATRRSGALAGVRLEEEGSAGNPRWVGAGSGARDEFDLRLGPSGMARSYPGTGFVAAEGWIPAGGRRAPTLDELRSELDLPEDWCLDPAPPEPEVGVAPVMRVGPLFLLGAAARRRPAGAWRSSDLDLAEAENLAWKLGAVVRGAGEDLLDSYPLERLPPARALGRAAEGLLPRLCEERVMGFLGPLLRAAFIRKALGESAAGLRGGYPSSPWCLEEGSGPRNPPPGARLPEVRYEDEGGRRRWLQRRLGPLPTVLRFGDEGPAGGLTVSRHLRGPGVLHDPDGSVHRALGGRTGGVLVVRPDGVIGYRAWPEGRARTEGYLARLGLPLREAS